MLREIKFKDLSTPLKISVIGGWFAFIWFGMIFILILFTLGGFIQ